MAQIKYSVNLSAADFVFSLSFKGPSVVIPGPDQNYFQGTAGWAGETPQRGINIPQAVYMENTVPTAEGYRSVSYKWFIEPTDPPERFVKINPIFDGAGSAALMGLTADRELWGVGIATGGEWDQVSIIVNPNIQNDSFPSWNDPTAVSWTTVQEKAVVCIQGVGIFEYHLNSNTMVHADIQGIDDTLVYGVCSSSNYLIVWDATHVYWSSTTDPFDFTPSLISGAGSAQIAGLKGQIVHCKEIGGGFIIYSGATVVGAAYTANQALPWTFQVLSGGSGISKPEHVAADLNTQIHFAWTSAGLFGIELHQAKPMFPQVTDFIASRLADYTNGNSYPITEYVDSPKEIRLAVISSRYLTISFGFNLFLEDEFEYQIPHLTQTLLYDIQLQRWGKLNIDHIQLFEAPFINNPDTPYLVSKPYPYEFMEELGAESYSFFDKPPAYWIDDLETAGVEYLDGVLKEPLVEYEYGPEELEAGTFVYEDGTLAEPVVKYSWEEELEVEDFIYEDGILEVQLIRYTYWDTIIDDESLEVDTFTYIDGTLA